MNKYFLEITIDTAIVILLIPRRIDNRSVVIVYSLHLYVNYKLSSLL